MDEQVKPYTGRIIELLQALKESGRDAIYEEAEKYKDQFPQTVQLITAAFDAVMADETANKKKILPREVKNILIAKIHELGGGAYKAPENSR